MIINKYVYIPEGEYPQIAWIVADKYDISVEEINEMFSILKKDFSLASQEQVRVVGLGGSRYKGMISLEYTLPKHEHVPYEYTTCKRMEPKN